MILSNKKYERLKRRDRRVLRSEDMPQELVDAILNAEPPADTRRYDSEAQ